MAGKIYIINGVYGGAFTLGNDGPDKLIITSTGLVDDVFLDQLGAWTVTVNGGVQGTITLAQNATPGSTITIGRTGLVQDNDTGILLRGDATVKNSGLITGTRGIQLWEGDSHVITNAGTITGSLHSILSIGLSKDTVTNSGTLNGPVSLDRGEDHLFNRGKIFGPVGLGADDDYFKVSGKGIVTGPIGLGDGNDTFLGGAGSESVYDDPGDDIIDLGGGNDVFTVYAAVYDDTDVIKGGPGIDTYNVLNVTLGISINLDKVAHNEGLSQDTSASANTVTVTVVSGGGTDTIIDKISGFENARGGSGADTIYGSAASNELSGDDGADQLYGFGGNDYLYGGDGNDTLDGGRGSDTLYGGINSDSLNGGDGTDRLYGQDGSDTLDGGGGNDVLQGQDGSDTLDGGSGNDWLDGGADVDTLTGGLGADRFFFNALADSGATDTTRDVIEDFSHAEGDKIDLRGIDADTATPGVNDAFAFLVTDAPFSNRAKELRVQSITNADNTKDTLVEGDVDGNGVADFSFLLKGNITLSLSDFIL